jgi:hypothetical protein
MESLLDAGIVRGSESEVSPRLEQLREGQVYCTKKYRQLATILHVDWADGLVMFKTRMLGVRVWAIDKFLKIFIKVD